MTLEETDQLIKLLSLVQQCRESVAKLERKLEDEQNKPEGNK